VLFEEKRFSEKREGRVKKGEEGNYNKEKKRRMSLRQWVSDQLMNLVGFAENNVVDYIIALAKKENTVGSFLSIIEGQGIPNNSSTERFARDLFSKLPAKTSASTASTTNAARQKEREALALRKKNESYSLILDDDDKASTPASSAASSAANGGQKKKNLRKRLEDDDEPEEKTPKKTETKKAVEEDDDYDYDRDAREVAEVNKMLREKDKKSTKKVGMSKAEIEVCAYHQEEANEMRRSIRLWYSLLLLTPI